MPSATGNSTGHASTTGWVKPAATAAGNGTSKPVAFTGGASQVGVGAAVLAVAAGFAYAL